MSEARSRLNQIGLPDAVSGQATFVGELGDLSKQMATIHWIEARCFELSGEPSLFAGGPACYERKDCASSLGEHFKKAVEFAWKSQVAIEAKIYISYADFLLKHGHKGEELMQVLRRSIEVETEKSKLLGASEQHLLEIGRLRYKLAKIAKPREALNQLEEACRHIPNQFQWLTLAGQLAYELNLVEKSEFFYLKAVRVALAEEEMRTKTLDASPENVDLARRKLASAHANYGAILQVSGKLDEASKQYRRSLDCNPLNEVSATNLARLNKRLLDRKTKLGKGRLPQ